MLEITSDIRNAFAPSGELRASINVGNPILAYLDPKTGQASGVSVDLATRLAATLDVPLSLRVVSSAGESVAVVADGIADVSFFAIDPERGRDIAFTSPYVVIEGCYLVRDDSPLTGNHEVDASGLTVVVGKGSAYDLFLSRSLSAATILRAPTSPSVVEVFLREGADVAAGVRQQLEADMESHAGLRLLPDRFMQIRQAMGVHKSRGTDAEAFLRHFVEEAKSDGFVREALERHRVSGVSVAPLEA